MAFRHILLNVGLILIVIIILSRLSTAKNDTEIDTEIDTETDTELNHNVLNGIHVIPLHYDVKIKFDVYRNVFLGKCNVTIQIKNQTKTITINSKAIAMIKIDLIDTDDNQKINIQKYSFINKTYIHLDFTQSSEDFLSSGTYMLRMIYVRTLLDDEDFFESIYTNKTKGLNNESIKVIRARELFPCWDEPDLFKSTFNISIWHHKNYKFFSSMPIREQVESRNNMLWTHFDKSSSMHAQHLTIVVTTFTYFFISATNVKFWYRKEMADMVQFTECFVKGVIKYLKQKSTRELSKIDYFVIEDFQYSKISQYNVKMSGFILLRQGDVIYNYTTDHIVRKIEVANLIARETISQWYYDVFLWSKEGFIMFLAVHILNQTELYRMMDLFVVQTLQDFLRYDILPIISHPSQIANISTVHSFGSSFEYIKSSIIWRMLYYIISDNVFWTAVNTYVNIQYNQINATDTSNLTSIVSFWRIVENILAITTSASNFNIENVLNMWLTVRHCPLLYVTRYYNKLFHNDSVLISYTNSHNISFVFMQQYEIYVTYTTKSVMNFEPLDTKYEFWLSSSVPLHYQYKINNYDWIIFNLQQVGYYRVNYDLDNWSKLADYLYFTNYTHIHVLNRAQIIDDAFYFLVQKRLNFTLFWNITSFLLKDADYVTWYPMIKAIEYMTCIWPIQHIVNIKTKIKKMLTGLLLNIGYNDKFDESDFTKCLREEVVRWACVLDDYKCKQIATFQLEKQLENPVEDKYFNWREWIYCKGLMTASHATWSKVLLWHKWNITYNNIYSEYLTCSTDPYTIQVYLDAITYGYYFNIMNNQTIANIVLLIFAKHANNNNVLNFIFYNFEFFKFSLKKQVDQIAILIIIITHEHNVEQFNKISEFVRNNLTMSDKLVNAVEKKINQRKFLYQKRIVHYGSLGAY